MSRGLITTSDVSFLASERFSEGGVLSELLSNLLPQSLGSMTLERNFGRFGVFRNFASSSYKTLIFI